MRMRNNLEIDMSVATTILNQLGGNKFRVMTGAKNFMDHGNALSMRIGRNSSNSNYLKITLNDSDLYDVRFSKVTKMGEEKSVREFNDVYNDMLVEIFESHTGMYTSL
jgi:hypothetical protein|tara:strand:+ start:139 stop:462 length:324 start_codon:yes stop_codon:yes gene_type:complete